jgi:hypothetical protein
MNAKNIIKLTAILVVGSGAWLGCTAYSQTTSITAQITSNIETNWVTEYTKTYQGTGNSFIFQAPVQHQHAMIVSNVILNVQWMGRVIPVTVEKHDITPTPAPERDWTDREWGLIKCNASTIR